MRLSFGTTTACSLLALLVLAASPAPTMAAGSSLRGTNDNDDKRALQAAPATTTTPEITKDAAATAPTAPVPVPSEPDNADKRKCVAGFRWVDLTTAFQ